MLMSILKTAKNLLRKILPQPGFENYLFLSTRHHSALRALFSFSLFTFYYICLNA